MCVFPKKKKKTMYSPVLVCVLVFRLLLLEPGVPRVLLLLLLLQLLLLQLLLLLLKTRTLNLLAMLNTMIVDLEGPVVL